MEPERDGDEQCQPLLHATAAAEQPHQQHYQYLGRSSSSVLRGGWGGAGGPEVSVDEIKSAASFSSAAAGYYAATPAPATLGDQLYPYPPSINSAVLSPSPSPAPASTQLHGMSSAVLCFFRLPVNSY